MGQEGKVPLKSAQLYFNLSERVRKVVESYFHLETPLYFSYTHLVCRSAFDGKHIFLLLRIPYTLHKDFLLVCSPILLFIAIHIVFLSKHLYHTIIACIVNAMSLYKGVL